MRVFLYAVPRSGPDAVYIGLNDHDKAWHDLYKLKISTGERTLVFKNSEKDRITEYIFDWEDQLRLAMRSNQDGSTDILRVDNDSLIKIYSFSVFETAFPVGFTKDNKNVLLVTNKGEQTDLMHLVSLDPITLKEVVVESGPLRRVDISNVVVSDVTRDIIYTVYEDDRERYVWKDNAYKKDYETIKKSLPDKNIDFSIATTDEQVWLINAYSDTHPANAYIYDRKNQKLTFQYNPRPKLPTGDLAHMTPVSYKSSDGSTIPAYLTLPKGTDGKNLPVVILPHGGPWGRDSWGYNSFVQFLANRGYAVLSPNFRASTGYGKKFLNPGNNEWGQKMQDDITWGVKYLIEQGIADKNKVGIMGGSYGGYATLAGLAFTPDTYACGVSIVGPSNLITLLNSIPPYWESIRAVFHFRMGNPSTPEGKTQLERQSPLNSATNIKAPLLLV